MRRKVRSIVTGTTQFDGAGVKLVRVIGHSTVKEFDPFLMLDAFDSTDPRDYTKGFPWHPHRGIETITYLIHGDIEHGDSIGNKGSILDGCCQWMTAGGGILHQEMPKAADRMLGVQLWLNLPQKEKMTAPKYRDIRADAIPKVEEPGISIGVISGQYKDVKASVEGDHVRLLFLDVELMPGVSWALMTEPQNTLFAYIMEGEGRFEADSPDFIEERHAVLFDDGDAFTVQASLNGIRFLLLSAKALGEPVAWGGPIVMNTREELDLAFQELQDGTFIR